MIVTLACIKSMVTNLFLPVGSRLLHLTKKRHATVTWLTLQANRREKKGNSHTPIDAILKSMKSWPTALGQRTLYAGLPYRPYF